MSTDPIDSKKAPGSRETFSAKAIGIIAATAFIAWGLAFVALPIAEADEAGISPFEALCRAIGLTSSPVRVAAFSGPSHPSNFVLNAAMLRHIAGGDPAKGAVIAEEVCWSCHMANGETSDTKTTPSITGQSAAAIYKQLWDLKTRARVSEVMAPIAEKLDDAQMADVSAYFAGLRRRNQNNPEAIVVAPSIVRLVLNGDASRALPPCAACHSPRAGGPLETPLLAGQYPPYVEAQLRAYASGTRKNDQYARMRQLARKLKDEEIAGLSAYYNAPPATR